MRAYRLRIGWYFAVSALLVLILILLTELMVGGVLSALFIYLPVSLLWLFLSKIFYRAHMYGEKTFGVPSQFVGYGILGIGTMLVASYIALGRVDIAKLGFILVFSGVDWMLTLREGKQKKAAHDRLNRQS